MVWHLSYVAYFLRCFDKRLTTLVLTVDVIGATFLLLLTITSFKLVSRQLTRRAWARLHKTGVYAIWLLALYIYQGGARTDRDLIHVVLLAVLVAAWSVRASAWIKVRSTQGNKNPQSGAR